MTCCLPDLKLTSLWVGEILAGLSWSSVQSIYVTLHHVFVMHSHLQPTLRLYLVRLKSNECNKSTLIVFQMARLKISQLHNLGEFQQQKKKIIIRCNKSSRWKVGIIHWIIRMLMINFKVCCLIYVQVLAKNIFTDPSDWWVVILTNNMNSCYPWKCFN